MAPKKKFPVSAHDLERIIVRLPDGMREQIAALAEANSRSMTAEVVAALEQHLKGPDRLGAIEAFIEKHREGIEAITKIRGSVENLEHTVKTRDGGVTDILGQLKRRTAVADTDPGRTDAEKMAAERAAHSMLEMVRISNSPPAEPRRRKSK